MPLPSALPPAPAPPPALVEPALGSSAEDFDAIARAQLLAASLPRSWRGVYRSFDDGSRLPVELQLEQVTPMGQMLDLRGSMTIGGVVTPVQGNLNAKSDQLDLLTLGDNLPAGLENGGEFLGLQMLALSGWEPPRLTSGGGRLQLVPGPAPRPAGGRAGTTVRGLW
ncbi:MAG: hypothetical protein VKM01_07770 [Cyanobacteriota bacterium]|nr:hypothetical protein [Cyanobacteriota bacterium]